jgi:hypothetical protein
MGRENKRIQVLLGRDTTYKEGIELLIKDIYI